MGRYIPAPEGRREKIGLIQRILRGRDASKRVIGAFVQLNLYRISERGNQK